MKEFQCKKCMSNDVSITIGVNPNDRTKVKSLVLQLVNEQAIEEDIYWCNKCNDYSEISVCEVDMSHLPEDELFCLWQEGEQDLFVVSINYYRKSDNQSLGGEDKIYDTKEKAEQHINEYIKGCDVKQNKETYHEFIIRILNMELNTRLEFNDPQTLLETFLFEKCTIIHQNKI